MNTRPFQRAFVIVNVKQTIFYISEYTQKLPDPRRENRFSENRLSEISDAYFRLEIGKN